MSHARQQLRDFVVAGLSTLAITGDRVYVGRTRPLGANHQPSLLVYTRAETSSRTVYGDPPTLERVVMLHIEGRVLASTPPDDLLDDIGVEVEAGIAALINYPPPVQFFNGMAQNVEMVSNDVAVKAEGDKHVGSIVLSYRVTYLTFEGNPSNA